MFLAPVDEGTAPLLETKLFIPAARARRVPRPRLVAQLDPDCSLTLVSAPAGFGKTTLVSDWIRARRPPVGWLSLDPADSDLRRFASYLARVVDDVVPGAGQRLRDFLSGPHLPPLETLLIPLINELTARDQPFVLVLDDYHVIDAPEVHAAVELLVERLPPGVRLILTTRADPPFALPRMRARGLVQEVRAVELRFDEEEIVTFLRDVMDLPLEAEQAAVLGERTEGWITGLQLAALSLRGRQDFASFLEGFTETNRYVLDYLIEEVIERQPASTLESLLALSISERFCGRLCDALTGGGDGEWLLEALEAENLFLVPLDDHRRWFRFHHLFRSLLREQSRRRLHTSERKKLHGRASDWFRGEGLIDEAFEHALAAKDRERVCQLLRAEAGPRMRQGDICAVMGWFDATPAEWLGDDPRLVIDHAMALFLSFRWHELVVVLENAARLQIEDPDHPFAGELATLETVLATAVGQPARAADRARKALALLPKDASAMRGTAAVCLAAALVSLGEYREVRGLLQKARRWHRLAGDRFAMAFTGFLEGNMEALRGQLHRAHDRYRGELARLGAEPGLAPSVAAVLEVGQAEVLHQMGAYEAAESLAQKVLALGPQASPVASVRALAVRVAIHRSRFEIEQALAVVGLVEELTTHTSAPAWQMMQETHRARVWALEARSPEAFAARERLESWIREHRLLDPERFEANLLPDHPREAALLCAVRWLLTEERYPEALEWLARVRATAVEGEWRRAEIETWLLEAQAHGDNPDAADRALGRAFELAAPEGYLQVVLDEIPWIAPRLRSRRGQELLAGLAPEIRTRFDQALVTRIPGPSSAEPGEGAATATDEVELLTEREVEVLAAIAEGLTNHEAGRRLYISSSTVKKHLENIYGKLGVHNRVEAITRCRVLGLLAPPEA